MTTNHTLITLIRTKQTHHISALSQVQVLQMKNHFKWDIYNSQTRKTKRHAVTYCMRRESGSDIGCGSVERKNGNQRRKCWEERDTHCLLNFLLTQVSIVKPRIFVYECRDWKEWAYSWITCVECSWYVLSYLWWLGSLPEISLYWIWINHPPQHPF